MATANNKKLTERSRYKDQVILVSGGYDHSIRFWNAEKGFCERIHQTHENFHINSLSISPRRDILASAEFQHIRLYDIETGHNKSLYNNEGIPKNVCSVGFDSSGNSLISCGEDGFARIWDTRTRQNTSQRNHKFSSAINSMFLHPNEIEIYLADQSGSIWIWNIQSDTVQRVFITNEGYIQNIAYDNECRMLAAADTLGNCYIFRITPAYSKDFLKQDNFEQTHSGYLSRHLMFNAHKKYILKCCFSPDSTILATASADKTVKFWRTSDLSIVSTTATIQIDDPLESNNASGVPFSRAPGKNVSASAAISYYKNYSSINDTELEYESAQSAFINLPYLNRLCSYGNLPARPPPCYLKQRRRTKRNGHYTTKCAKNNGYINQTCGCSNGNRLRHSSSCNSLKPSQLNLNIFDATIEKLKSPKTNPLNSPSKNSNHLRTTRSALMENILQATINDMKKNFQQSEKDKYQRHRHHHSHHHNSCQQLNPNLIDNKYVELHNRFENHFSFNRANNVSELKHEEDEEDEEFFKLLKDLQLIDSEDEEEDEEDIDEHDDEDVGTDDEMYDEGYCTKKNGKMHETESDDDTGENGLLNSRMNVKKQNRSKSATNSRSNSSSRSSSKIRSNECCCSCDCFSKLNNSSEDLNGGSVNNDGTGSLPKAKKNKNEWSYSKKMPMLRELSAPSQKWVWDLAFSADSQYIFTASSDNLVRLWSVYNGKLTREYNGHQKSVMAIAFSDITS